MCNPELFAKARPPSKQKVRRKAGPRKRGKTDHQTQATLRNWRREIYTRDHEGSMFSSKVILEDDLIELLSSHGSLSPGDVSLILREKWLWWDIYHEELTTFVCGLTIAYVLIKSDTSKDPQPPSATEVPKPKSSVPAKRRPQPKESGKTAKIPRTRNKNQKTVTRKKPQNEKAERVPATEATADTDMETSSQAVSLIPDNAPPRQSLPDHPLPSLPHEGNMTTTRSSADNDRISHASQSESQSHPAPSHSSAPSTPSHPSAYQYPHYPFYYEHATYLPTQSPGAGPSNPRQHIPDSPRSPGYNHHQLSSPIPMSQWPMYPPQPPFSSYLVAYPGTPSPFSSHAYPGTPFSSQPVTYPGTPSRVMAHAEPPTSTSHAILNPAPSMIQETPQRVPDTPYAPTTSYFPWYTGAQHERQHMSQPPNEANVYGSQLRVPLAGSQPMRYAFPQFSINFLLTLQKKRARCLLSSNGTRLTTIY